MALFQPNSAHTCTQQRYTCWASLVLIKMLSCSVYFEINTENGQHVYLCWVHVCVKIWLKSAIGYRNIGKTAQGVIFGTPCTFIGLYLAIVLQFGCDALLRMWIFRGCCSRFRTRARKRQNHSWESVLRRGHPQLCATLARQRKCPRKLKCWCCSMVFLVVFTPLILCRFYFCVCNFWWWKGWKHLTDDFHIFYTWKS